jgi:hypothetical protein
MKSTIGLFKTEAIEQEKPTGRSWSGRPEIEKATASWVHWSRLHSSAGMMNFINFENTAAPDREAA